MSGPLGTCQSLLACFRLQLALAVLGLMVGVAGCTEFSPLPTETLDAIGKYEKNRAEIKQAHTHVHYCDNDTLKLTISSRGQLAIREIYVPRKSVALFRNRDTLNTYPLGVLLYKACILEGPTENCPSQADRIGVNVAALDTAEGIFESFTEYDKLEFYGQGYNGLYEMRVRESEREKPIMKLRKENKIYANFSPDLVSGEDRLPTLIVLYKYHQYMRPDIRRCSWYIITDEAIHTSRASHCDDLSDWQTYVSEFDRISDKISKEGEFSHNCKD